METIAASSAFARAGFQLHTEGFCPAGCCAAILGNLRLGGGGLGGGKGSVGVPQRGVAVVKLLPRLGDGRVDDVTPKKVGAMHSAHPRLLVRAVRVLGGHRAAVDGRLRRGEQRLWRRWRAREPSQLRSGWAGKQRREPARRPW